uniref:Cytochrome b5 heme-binding domain-containing protein n=1 Tax=Chromera velia CCMP2878 TaxID=1169474 RepID=A0A0G4HCT5_9ALVE|mmetsp:Transcript_34842/g.68790  ORF Transcript_34842/g.68790 Transcript_34842/m.68790 type:complete len:135 (-) Transcript_34842:541-945(-)|eukprot:Cvel_26315.t1-p1 / transcript=Cvel_26315.t1 / gene=Cvel_26315 / organism=Chromera_velia_CCMP2878 / gene_product=Cytochrome b5, putative / transcript_product=Cytochrome b5, putative / location=Cvel_scaffold3109:6449-7090(-) / protein_length=134 / sequence_SO=supercontig / SO=protein_coding / is_pseudo=false
MATYAEQKKLRVITMDEMAKHNTEEDCWMAIHGVVYDLTKFLPDHPGGPEIVVGSAGKDATDEFEEIGHSDNSRVMAEEYEIGVLEGWEEKATGCVIPKEKQGQSSKQKGSGLAGMLPLIAVAAASAVAYYTLK